MKTAHVSSAIFRNNNYLKLSTALALFCLMLFLLSNFSLLLADEAVQIGGTNCPNALADNNTRKIVRTSFDRRVVVFQDSSNHRPAIKLTFSDDGINWTEPSLLDFGSEPSLAIGQDDQIYSCWIGEDGDRVAICLLTPDTSTSSLVALKLWVCPAFNEPLQHPAIEVTKNSVNLVYQAPLDSLTHIYYQRYSRDLQQTLSTFIRLSDENEQSEFPVIAGDLYFEQDLIYIFWTDAASGQQDSKIRFSSIEEHVYADSIGGSISLGGELPFTNVSINSASLSAGTNTVIASFVSADQSSFITAMLSYSASGFEVDNSDVIQVTQNPMPSVDDVYIQSCAVCWCDSNAIFYSQNHNGHFIIDPVAVSARDVNARQPNVCYRSFRQDIFDVVWLEGDTPPFRVMYRRMKKDYGPVNVEKLPDPSNIPQNFDLLPCYPNPFNLETVIPVAIKKPTNATISIYDVNGKLVQKIFSGQLSPGVHKFHWNAKNSIQKIVGSGLYFVRLGANGRTETRKLILVK
ncbi:MAG: T9SS type A sorting domain-containing protein [Calditrichaeota bacterium]|nr:T9SS type A sorting domain-containing protein [Calditrichota bacterium]